MPGPRRRLVALITSGVTLALTAGLGSPLAGDHLSSHGNALLAGLIKGLRYPQWSLRPVSSMTDSILVWITPMVADVVLAALTGLVAAVIVANRTRLPALLAGWATAMVLAVAVGVGRVYVIAAVNHPGSSAYGQAGTVITTGLWFGLATGWLTGLIVACAVRRGADDEDSGSALIGDREVTGVRIWTPSQPDWQNTQDLPAQTLRQPSGQTTTMQPATAQPATAQPTTGQPWPPASAP
jgi:hypothetical protein